MSDPATPPYRRVLVTTDFSDCALAGVREAARIGRELGADLVLLFVAQDEQPYMMLGSALHWDEVLERQQAEARTALEQYARKHLPNERVKTVVAVGNPVAAIARTATDEGADLIVMSSHGHGFLRRVALGSTTERVLQRAPCPVLVVPPPA